MAKLVKLSKKDVKGILNDYNIGTYSSHKHIPWALGNSVYFLDTSKGKFILKIHQEIKLRKLNFVLDTMEFVRGKKIPVPETIKTKDGKLVDLKNKEMVTIQKFIKGETAGMSKNSIIKNTARTIGLLDRALLKMPLKSKMHYSLSRKLIYDTVKLKGFDFIEQERQLRRGLVKINAQKLRKSVIHSDLGTGNILYKNETVTAILDWDDVNENYLVYDPAILLSHGFIAQNEILKDKIILFLKEYQKYVKLNAEEKKALYYLIMARQLSAASWVTRQLRVRKSRHYEGVKKLLSGYNLFSRLPLKEFLSWTN